MTANELHVPVAGDADAVPTFLALESADVVHSLLGAAARREDGRDPEPAQRDVDRAARAGSLSRAMRRVLRHPARAHAVARLCPPARGIRRLGGGAAAGGRGGSGRGGRTPHLRVDGLHQLPHGARHRCDRALRPGSHAPDESRHDRRRRGRPEFRVAARVDSRSGPRQARRADARDESRRRGTRRRSWPTSKRCASEDPMALLRSRLRCIRHRRGAHLRSRACCTNGPSASTTSASA